jgi:hypothetical protein
MQRAAEQDRLAIVAPCRRVRPRDNNPLAIIRQRRQPGAPTRPEEDRAGLVAMSRSLERWVPCRSAAVLSQPARRMSRASPQRCCEDCLQLMRHRLKGGEVGRPRPGRRVDARGRPPRVACPAHLLRNAHEGCLSSMRARSSGPDLRTLGASLCVPTRPGYPGKPLRIFDLFFTSGKPRAWDSASTICKRIERSHGGLIFAQSSQGSGTRISLDFPHPAPPVLNTFPFLLKGLTHGCLRGSAHALRCRASLRTSRGNGRLIFQA